MVKSKLSPNGNGIIAEDVWVSGMRQAGFSEQEIDRVVTATTVLAESGNGHGELVPVKEAARRIGRSENTVRSWIRLGHLRPVEIQPPPDHASGPWYHVDMTDVEELDRKANPPDEDEEEFISLRQAAERFNLKLSRLKGWVYRGHLEVRKRSHEGRVAGILLVNPADVEILLANPPRAGRIQSNVTLDRA